MYLLNDLAAGHSIEGPAIIIDQNRYAYYSILLILYNIVPASIRLLFKYAVFTIITWCIIVIIYDCHLIHSTILVEPQCTAYITTSGDIRIEVS